MRINHNHGGVFSWTGNAVLSIVCLLAWTTSGYSAVFMSATNETINAGQAGTVTVSWTSTQPINYLQTEFILTAVTGPTAGLSFTTTPSVPLPTWTGTYVFGGDSFQEDYYNTTTNAPNPASVSQTNWANDTHNYNDMTLSGNDYAQDGTRYWLVLSLTAAAGGSGTYQLTFGSSEFDYFGSAGATALLSSDLSGGLITINGGGGGGAIPEPASGLVVAGLLAAGGLSRVRRKV